MAQGLIMRRVSRKRTRPVVTTRFDCEGSHLSDLAVHPRVSEDIAVPEF